MAEQTQTKAPDTVDLAKYIEVRIFGDRPHIRGRRIPVSAIAYTARSQQWSVADLVYQYSISEAEALAALLYYQEHQELIDAQEAEEQRQMDEMFQLYGKH